MIVDEVRVFFNDGSETVIYVDQEVEITTAIADLVERMEDHPSVKKYKIEGQVETEEE
jgi:hypothetical protein